MLLRRGVFTYPCPRKLREVAQVSMLGREPTESIKSIWSDYYKDNLNIVSGSMTTAKFNFLLQKSKESPFFIFPVFRKGGHFILLSQT